MKVLAFSPHAFIWVHSFPEALALKALKDGGLDVTYIQCDRAYKTFCTCMNSVNLNISTPEAQREKICRVCIKNSDAIVNNFGFKGFALSSFLDQKDLDQAQSFSDSINFKDCLSFIFDGFELGRFAAYELIVRLKLSRPELTEEMREVGKIHVRNAIISFLALRKAFIQVQPDRCVVYNSYYMPNKIAAVLAQQNGIPVYSLHGGMSCSDQMYRSLIVGRNHSYQWIKDVIRHWPLRRNTPINRKEAEEIKDHYKSLFAAKSPATYSCPPGGNVDIRAFFGIEISQKIVVATLSSSDELLAYLYTEDKLSESDLIFPTTIEWVEQLISFFKKRKDIFLIIRVHPREFPNKRESKLSQSGKKMKEQLVNLPVNVRVNWPDDRLSLYDIAEVADLVLNAWSSAGKELSIFGIPVLTYAGSLLFYPDDLCYSVKNRDEYFNTIDIALNKGWSSDCIIRSFRWHAMELVNAMIDIGEDYIGKPSYRSSKTWMRIESVCSRFGLSLNRFVDFFGVHSNSSYKSIICDLIVSAKKTKMDIVPLDNIERSNKDELSIIKETLMEILKVRYNEDLEVISKDTLKSKLLAFIQN